MSAAPGGAEDCDRTLEAVRSLVWQRRTATLPGRGGADARGAGPSAETALGELAGILARLERAAEAGPAVPPYSRLRRPIRGMARRVARMVVGLLQPVVRDQSEVNRAVAEALGRLREATEGEVAELRRRLSQLEQGLAEIGRKTEAALESQERTSSLALARTFDAGSFDRAVRGNDDELRERLRCYVPLFAGCRAVLDVACGRGAFLDLLREAGIGARGVDLDENVVRDCRARGLEVACGDALGYLRDVEDESFDGIFCCEFVEHLTAPELATLIDLFARKLRPGGILVIETLHPECLQVLSRWFWLDPTHQRLVHPVTLAYLLESRRFREVETRLLRPVPEREVLPPLPSVAFAPELVRSIEAFNQGAAELNRILFGSPEYYVRAVR